MTNENKAVDYGSANSTPKGRRGNKNMKSAEKTVTTPNNGTINGNNTETTPKSKRNKKRKMQNNTDNNASENTTSENEISINESPKNKNKKKKNKKQKQQNANNNSQTEGEKSQDAQTNKGKKRNRHDDNLSAINRLKKHKAEEAAYKPDPKDISFEYSLVELFGKRSVYKKDFLLNLLSKSEGVSGFESLILKAKSKKVDAIKESVKKVNSLNGKMSIKVNTGYYKTKRSLNLMHKIDKEPMKAFFGAKSMTLEKGAKKRGKNKKYLLDFESEEEANKSDAMCYKYGALRVNVTECYPNIHNESPKKNVKVEPVEEEE